MKRFFVSVTVALALLSLVAVVFGEFVWSPLPNIGLVGLGVACLVFLVINFLYRNRNVAFTVATRNCGDFEVTGLLILSDINDPKQNMLLTTDSGRCTVTAYVRSYSDGDEVVSLTASIHPNKGGCSEQAVSFLSQSGVFVLSAEAPAADLWRETIDRTEAEDIVFLGYGVAVRMADGAGEVSVSLSKNADGKVVAVKADLAHEDVT
jgi:hypothetical protein